MEGPSLFLAAEQLSPFIGKKILSVTGNSKIEIERMNSKKIINIFSWGKHLVFQFDNFALRVHFMLFGSFEATVDNKLVTGDYPKKQRIPRLAFVLKNGHIEMYSCSLRFIESSHAMEEYDFTIDIMSLHWDSKKALLAVHEHPEGDISDLLLDQTIFSGVGNIIRNEVLFLESISPLTKIKDLSLSKLRKIIKKTQKYVVQFYEWRKLFVLRKHFQIYRKSTCPKCLQKIVKKKTGQRDRMSYFCPNCQK
jgi:endonuclease VIII